MRRSVLLVAATELELCGHAGLACGIGPVEAAAETARALAHEHPDAVVHVGLAGGVGIALGTVVVGTESLYADISAAIPVVSRVEPDPVLVNALLGTLPDARALPIVTSAAVSGPSGSEPQADRVEGMEGFAVLRACELAAIPAVEVRAISNELGEEDRERWELDRGLAALAAVIPRVLTAVAE